MSHNREKYLRETYGITNELYEELARNGCYMCGYKPKEGTYLEIDHDHTTNKIRGILCRSCNMGLAHKEMGLNGYSRRLLKMLGLTGGPGNRGNDLRIKQDEAWEQAVKNYLDNALSFDMPKRIYTPKLYFCEEHQRYYRSKRQHLKICHSS